MSAFTWYSKVTSKPDDLEQLGLFFEYFEKQYAEAQRGLKPTGRIMTFCAELPGKVEHRFGQLQILESVLVFYERRAQSLKLTKKRGFLEHYNRTLTDRQADQFADIDSEVQQALAIVDEIALLRNKYLGLTKAYEMLHFQTGNIIHLKKAMIEDATFDVSTSFDQE